MWNYIFKRLGQMLPVVGGVVLLSFLLFNVVGGSPASFALGQNATAQALDEFDQRSGYDQPLFAGNWRKTRLLAPDMTGQSVADPGSGGHVLSLRFAYVPTEGGRYRLVARVSSGGEASVPLTAWLIPGDEGEPVFLGGIEARPRGQRVELVFDVPADKSATGLQLRAEGVAFAVGGAFVQARNAHFWNSLFVHVVRRLLRGDLGVSTESNQRVATILRRGVMPSLAVSVPILLGMLLPSIVLALLCAWWRDRLFDRVAVVVATALMSVNYIVWIVAGQYFLAYRMGWFPIWGFESGAYLILPVLIGIVTGLGRDVRFYRTVMLEEMQKDYIRTARAKGAGWGRILFRHVLGNVWPPIITNVSMSIPFLFTGSLLLESFFGIPGLGGISVNAIYSSDLAVVQAVVLIGALLSVVINLLTDLCYAWVDPRVRLT